MEKVADPGNSSSLGRGQSSWPGKICATNFSTTKVWVNAHLSQAVPHLLLNDELSLPNAVTL